MSVDYINEVFHNYYKSSIEDRKKLVDRLKKLHDEEKYDFNYDYSCILEYINETIDQIIKAKNFKSFYLNLNEKQKKEFQTQVYLFSDKAKNKENNFNSYDLYSDLAHLINLNEDIEEIKDRETFKIDFEKLETEINYTNGFFYNKVTPENIISNYCRLFFNFTIIRPDKEKLSEAEYYRLVKEYSYPLIYELKEAINFCSSVIKNNINDSTRKMYESLSISDQIITILELLKINEEELNYEIKYRENIKKEILESIDKKCERREKIKLNPSKKLVKTKSNKMNNCRRYN